SQTLQIWRITSEIKGIVYVTRAVVDDLVRSHPRTGRVSVRQAPAESSGREAHAARRRHSPGPSAKEGDTTCGFGNGEAYEPEDARHDVDRTYGLLAAQPSLPPGPPVADERNVERCRLHATTVL